MIGLTSKLYPQDYYFTLLPSPEDWILFLLLILNKKRNNFLGLDAKLREKRNSKIRLLLSQQYPNTAGFFMQMRLVSFHACVFLAFLFEFVLIIWLRLNFLNWFSLTLLLLLLAVYLSRGIKRLASAWVIFELWTGIVLVTLFAFNLFANVITSGLSNNAKAYFYWIGFQKVQNGEDFWYFLTYATIFLVAHGFLSLMKSKIESES